MLDQGDPLNDFLGVVFGIMGGRGTLAPSRCGAMEDMVMTTRIAVNLRARLCIDLPDILGETKTGRPVVASFFKGSELHAIGLEDDLVVVIIENGTIFRWPRSHVLLREL